MSSSLATLVIGIATMKRRKESPIAPFVRTAELAEEEQRRALTDLENATNELVKAVEERNLGK